MLQNLQHFRDTVNLSRYHQQQNGFYESYFQRANHPDRPLAFWIRYTIFSPRSHPELAKGELWAIFFNGETHQHCVVKKEYPLADCQFSTSSFEVRVGDATLSASSMQGSAQSETHQLSWDLRFRSESKPLFFTPLNRLKTRFPSGKVLVALPLAHFQGEMKIDGEKIEIQNWVGSQNHNWGSRHTDHYAWGQVAGFENAPDTFLEVATARLKVGPLWTPALTPLVLWHKGSEYELNSLSQAFWSKGSFRYFDWKFCAETKGIQIDGRIFAQAEDFVGLRYFNPPGGFKYCLNSKLASCELKLTHKISSQTEKLVAKRCAAFEILTEDSSHGIPISA